MVCVKGQLELTLLSDTQSGHHCTHCATTFCPVSQLVTLLIYRFGFEL